jgi:hypothetical protein
MNKSYSILEGLSRVRDIKEGVSKDVLNKAVKSIEKDMKKSMRIEIDLDSKLLGKFKSEDINKLVSLLYDKGFSVDFDKEFITVYR